MSKAVQIIFGSARKLAFGRKEGALNDARSVCAAAPQALSKALDGCVNRREM
jgi:hypothetical protein